jgi:hypothetical protein
MLVGMCWSVAADPALAQLPAHGPPRPTRCPYCPADSPPHWIGWGYYERYAGDRDDPSRKIAIPRWWCKLQRRTFSLLPDCLLPYHGGRTAWLLGWLYALYVQGRGLCTVARQAGVARGTLRALAARCQRTVPQLRLPAQEGARPPAAFLEALARLPAPMTVADLFRQWKQWEPKHSLLGFYRR